MSITLFGVIWIEILAYCFCLKNIKYITFMTLLSTIFQATNVVVFGDIGVGPQSVSCVVFLLRALLTEFSLKLSISKKDIYLWLFSLVVLLSSVINGFSNTKTIFYLIQYFTYVLSFSLMKKIRYRLPNDFILKSITYITWFVVIVGVIQILMSSLIIPKFSIFRDLFYNQTGEAETFQFYIPYRYVRLFSTFMEPSYCGAFLVGAFYYFCSQWELFAKRKILITMMLIEILLTMSSTAYGTLLVGGIIFALYGKNKKPFKVLAPAAILILLILMVQQNIFNDVILQKFQSSSGLERSKWNRLALEKYNEAKVLGWGYKSNRASSLFDSLLVQFGLVGTVFYGIMILNMIKPVFKKKRVLKNAGVELFLISVVIAQLIACPDLDFCVFWFAMFINAIGLTNAVHKDNTQEQIKR